MSEDLISRQEAINRIETIEPTSTISDYQKGIAVGFALAKKLIREQKSAYRKTGHWIWKKRQQHYAEKYTLGVNAILTDRFPASQRYLANNKAEVYIHHNFEEERNYCSECGKLGDDTFFNYCPNCGAKMEEVENE